MALNLSQHEWQRDLRSPASKDTGAEAGEDSRSLPEYGYCRSHVAVVLVVADDSKPGAFFGALEDQGDELAQQNVVTVGEGRTIYFPEKDLSTILSFEFDAVYDQENLRSSRDVYAQSVGYIVRDLLDRRGLASVIVAGEEERAKTSLVEGGPEDSGLVVHSVVQIFRAVSADVVVRISWYQIYEPTEENSLSCPLFVDMLAYATSKNYTPAGKISGSKVRKVLGETVELEGLHELMEDEEGGVEPSNLVHVEIKCAADVLKLIKGVKDALPSTRFLKFVEQVGIPIAPGKRTANAHSVITISVEGASDDNGLLASAAAAAAVVKASRLRIVTLGNSQEGEASWARQFEAAVTDAGERKVPTRFGELDRRASRSVIPLVLRDVLLRRVPSSFIACVSPGLTRAGPTSACLKAAARFRAACGLPLSGILDESFAASTGASPFRGTVDSAEKGVVTADSNSRIEGEKSDQSNSSSAHAVAESTSPSLRTRENELFTDDEMPGVKRQSSSPHKGTARKVQQLLGEEFSSRFTSGAEVGEDEDEVSQTEQVTQDAQDEKVLALGRAGSVDNVAALVSDLSARDSEAAQWFTAMLSALEASRTEVAALQEQIYRSSQSPSRKVALESTPRSGGRQLPLEPKDSNTKLQQRNRQLVRELRDYERYKDVVESTIMRLKDEMHAMGREREHVMKQKKRDEALKRKLRQEVAAAKKEVESIKEKNREIKKQMARTRAELGKQRKQLLAKTTRAEALKETASTAAELLVGQLEARKDEFAKELRLERETLESTQNALEKALRDKGRTAEILEEVQTELEEEKAKSRKLARKLDEATRVAAATADVKLKEAHATIQYLRGELVQVRTAVQALALRDAESRGIGTTRVAQKKGRGHSPQLDEIKSAIKIEEGLTDVVKKKETKTTSTSTKAIRSSGASTMTASATSDRRTRMTLEKRRAEAAKLARRKKKASALNGYR